MSVDFQINYFTKQTNIQTNKQTKNKQTNKQIFTKEVTHIHHTVPLSAH